mgnify:CR=1 FL=1
MKDDNDLEDFFSNLDNTWSTSKVKVTYSPSYSKNDSYDDVIKQFDERIKVLENQVKILTMKKILKE